MEVEDEMVWKCWNILTRYYINVLLQICQSILFQCFQNKTCWFFFSKFWLFELLILNKTWKGKLLTPNQNIAFHFKLKKSFGLPMLNFFGVAHTLPKKLLHLFWFIPLSLIPNFCFHPLPCAVWTVNQNTIIQPAQMPSSKYAYINHIIGYFKTLCRTISDFKYSASIANDAERTWRM